MMKLSDFKPGEPVYVRQFIDATDDASVAAGFEAVKEKAREFGLDPDGPMHRDVMLAPLDDGRFQISAAWYAP